MSEYIEKEVALDIVNGWRDQLIPTYGKNDEYVKCLETVAKHLESLHAADVRPVVRSHWEISCDGWYPYCPACGAEPPGRAMTPFCPMCGADMREGKP